MECKCHSPMQILGYNAFDRFDSKNLVGVQIYQVCELLKFGVINFTTSISPTVNQSYDLKFSSVDRDIV